MATTEQTLTANHNQIIADTISQAFNENSTEIFARQLAAKKLISLSHNLDNAELVKLYQDEADIQIAMARTLLTNQPNRYELDDTTFKTDYKFASKEEKAIYQRFVENHKKNNTYMFYAVTDKDLNFKTADGEYFYNKNPHLLERFDEITNYEFIIVDKQFLANNDIWNTTHLGRRYIYYVDSTDYAISCKEDYRNSIPSKIHPGTRVFKNYESLIEHLEERVWGKAIYILGEHAFNGLRYMVDSIEIAKYDNLNTPENCISLNVNAYRKFLGFSKIHKQQFDRTEIVQEAVNEDDKFFSDFIVIANKKHDKSKEAVAKKYIYDLLKIVKPAGSLQAYRFAKRKGEQTMKFVRFNDIVIELDIATNKIISTGPAFDTFEQNSDYVWHSTLKFVSIGANDCIDKKLAIELAKVMQVQFRDK
jgi:hypothetical protein